MRRVRHVAVSSYAFSVAAFFKLTTFLHYTSIVESPSNALGKPAMKAYYKRWDVGQQIQRALHNSSCESFEKSKQE